MSFGANLNALVASSADPRHCLPEGWVRTPLGEVASILNGFPFNSKGFGSAGSDVMRIRDVVRGFTTTKFSGDVPDGYWIERGDLVVGMDGDFNSAFWRSDRALLNQRVCKITPDQERVDRRFLAHMLPAYLNLINEHTSSVTVKHLSSRTLASIPLAIPALVQQRAIATRIDELFTEIDDGDAALGRAREDLGTWRKALLKAAVTGELTAGWRAANPPIGTGADLLTCILGERRKNWEAEPNNAGKSYVDPIQPNLEGLPRLPDSWTWASLGQLCTVITSGSRAWAQYYGRGPGTFIMAQNVRPGRYDDRFRQLVDPRAGDAERARTAVERNDLLLTIVGANTGDLCRFDLEPDNHYVCQSVALLRLTDPRHAALIEAFFCNDYGRKLQMEQMIYGAGRPHLSFDQIKSLAIPIAPIAESHEIRAAVAEILSKAKVNDEALSSLKTAPTTLRQSILAAAFRGDLA